MARSMNRCPDCGEPIAFSDEYGEREVTCQLCGVRLTIECDGEGIYLEKPAEEPN